MEPLQQRGPGPEHKEQGRRPGQPGQDPCLVIPPEAARNPCERASDLPLCEGEDQPSQGFHSLFQHVMQTHSRSAWAPEDFEKPWTSQGSTAALPEDF